MPTTPQDRKPKADAPFTFEVDGKKHTLPDVSEEAAASIPGGITYDAVMSPDDSMAQLRLGFATLEATSPKPESLAALKSLPTPKMLEVIGEWLGGSSGSSD